MGAMAPKRHLKKDSGRKSNTGYVDDDSVVSPSNSTTQTELSPSNEPVEELQETDEPAENVLPTTGVGGGEPPLDSNMELIGRSDSAGSSMPPDNHLKRRIIGAAATM